MSTQLLDPLPSSRVHTQLEERRKGNTAYKARRLPEAQECYRRALAIVEYARGGSAADQAEVDHNKVGEGEGVTRGCLLNG